MSSMPRRDQILWAKETILDLLDAEIQRLNTSAVMVIEDVGLEELTELLRQRNRIARTFRMPERTLYSRPDKMSEEVML